jgi:hypothetical protein
MLSGLRATSVAVAIAWVVLGACARDVRARYPTAPGDETGSIVLVLTRPSPDVYVAVNGVLVVDGAHTSRVRIDGVETGYAELVIAIGPLEKAVKVWVDAGRDSVLPVAGVGGSTTESIKNMVMSLAAVALYAWIR